jgi:acyl-ACP thioesterase
VVDVSEMFDGAPSTVIQRTVRLGDVDADGRLRVDAVVRACQDIADDDGARLPATPGGTWVVRQTFLRVERLPAYRQPVSVSTWVSGVGSAWAERRVRIGRRPDQPDVEAVVLWVHVDATSFRPRRLTPEFVAAIPAEAAARKVSGKLVVPAMPTDAARGVGAWRVRTTDLDALGHVNNAAVWEAVHEHLVCGRAEGTVRHGGFSVVVEHRDELRLGDDPEVFVDEGRLWLVVGGRAVVAAELLADQTGT